MDPSAALRKSVDIGVAYGMKYVEIYSTDVVSLHTATNYAHNALTAPIAPTPTPTPTPPPQASTSLRLMP